MATKKTPAKKTTSSKPPAEGKKQAPKPPAQTAKEGLLHVKVMRPYAGHPPVGSTVWVADTAFLRKLIDHGYLEEIK